MNKERDHDNITAEKLYAIAMSTESSRVKKELDDVLQKLLKVANDSAFSVTIAGALLPGTVKELQKKHFKVECGDDRNETYTVISFQHAVGVGAHHEPPTVPPACFDR